LHLFALWKRFDLVLDNNHGIVNLCVDVDSSGPFR